MRMLELLQDAARMLKSAGIEGAAREAEALVVHCTGVDRVALYRDNLQATQEQADCVSRSAGRRASGEPLHYILGRVEFMGLQIKVGPGVLIPRPETELVAEEAISVLRAKAGRRVLDLCTGSGCLAVAIAKAVPEAEVHAVDISEAALAYAAGNARLNGASNVSVMKGDLFGPAGGRTYDLIVSNPPYVRSADIALLERGIRDFEPAGALDGGSEGLDYYRRILQEAPLHINKGGALVIELGLGQAGAVAGLARLNLGGPEIRIIKDFAGIERVISISTI